MSDNMKSLQRVTDNIVEGWNKLNQNVKIKILIMSKTININTQFPINENHLIAYKEYATQVIISVIHGTTE